MEGEGIEGGRDAKHPDIELVALKNSSSPTHKHPKLHTHFKATPTNTQSSTYTFKSHTHKATPTKPHPPAIPQIYFIRNCSSMMNHNFL